jgi:hypothetical protein
MKATRSSEDTLKMGMIRLNETLETTYKKTRRHNPEEHNPQFENLKPRTVNL